MKNIINKFLSMPIFVPIVLLLASLVALASAFTAEYGFDLEPCSLCLYERIPYFAVIVLAGVSIYFANTKPKIAHILCLVCGLVMLFEFGLSTYHVGVEKGIFEETCSAEFNTDDLDSLRESIFATPAVSCKDVQFEVFGISMAGWNAFYALGLALFVFMACNMQRKRI